MEKVTIYKNKGETFKCNFKIEGASAKDTVIRLCLEFSDHPNYFFYGELKSNGECVIQIPRLNNLTQTEGRLVVEAIADSVYFKVFESQVEFKNSVEITMQSLPNIHKTQETTVKLEEIAQSESSMSKAPENCEDTHWMPLIVEEPKYKSFSEPDYQVWGKPVTKSADVPKKEFRSFKDYTKKREA